MVDAKRKLSTTKDIAGIFAIPEAFTEGLKADSWEVKALSAFN
jgi:hypothetical protein